MTTAGPILWISLLLTIFCALALIPVFLLMRSSNQSKRLMEVTSAPLRLQESVAEARHWATRILLGLVHFVRTRLGLAQDEKLRQKLLAAGLREASDVDTYFGIRLLGPVAAVLAGTFIRGNTLCGSWP